MVQFLSVKLVGSEQLSMLRAFVLSGLLISVLTGCSGQTVDPREQKRKAYADANEALKEAEAAGVGALCSLLHDPRFIKREMAAYELGGMELDAAVAMEEAWRAGIRPTHPNGEEALDCLLRAVNDTSLRVRAFTATALGNFPEHRADSALKVQLEREQTPEVRKRLLVAIGSQLEQRNGVFLSNYPAPTLSDSLGIVLGAQEQASSREGSEQLVARCLPMYQAPALQHMVVVLLLRTDTATLVGRTDELLALARSQQGMSEQETWCRVFARIPGPAADAYLAEIAQGGLTSLDRETARAVLARRQRER